MIQPLPMQPGRLTHPTASLRDRGRGSGAWRWRWRCIFSRGLSLRCSVPPCSAGSPPPLTCRAASPQSRPDVEAVSAFWNRVPVGQIPLPSASCELLTFECPVTPAPIPGEAIFPSHRRHRACGPSWPERRTPPGSNLPHPGRNQECGRLWSKPEDGSALRASGRIPHIRDQNTRQAESHPSSRAYTSLNDSHARKHT